MLFDKLSLGQHRIHNIHIPFRERTVYEAFGVRDIMILPEISYRHAFTSVKKSVQYKIVFKSFSFGKSDAVKKFPSVELAPHHRKYIIGCKEDSQAFFGTRYLSRSVIGYNSFIMSAARNIRTVSFKQSDHIFDIVRFHVIVAVDKRDKFSARSLKSRISRGRHSAVILTDHNDPWITLRIFSADLLRTVGGSVIDEYDLEIGICLSDDRFDTLTQIVFRVIKWYNYTHPHEYDYTLITGFIKMSDSVSIIIPTINSEKYLEKCIDSVIAQKYADWELLIVDEASSDGTRDIAMSYAARDARISFTDSPGKGVSAARNHGIGIARGKYICFLDSDDTLDPDFLTVLLKLSNETDADISQSSFYYSYDDGKLTENNEAVSGVFGDRESIMYAFLTGMIGQINIASWGKLYKAELLKDIRFDEELRIQEDAFFNFLCCQKASVVACTDLPLYRYFQNPASVMNRPFNGSKMQYFIVFDRELKACSESEKLTTLILRRKLLTALDLTGEIIRKDSGRDYLGELRKIALDTYGAVNDRDDIGAKTGFKLFLLRHFPGTYYRILKHRH